MQNSKPELTVLPRRRFLKLVGAGAGVTAAAGLGIAVARRVASHSGAGASDVPVRNPAFQESTQVATGHLVLYCQTPGQQTLAYELNASAAAIWYRCVSHAQFTEGERKTLEDLCSHGTGDAEEVAEFVSVMASKGLVFLADGEAEVYFQYEERYS